MKRHKAFTLAEVLITLGIIGIVAAMTIPTVLQNAQNQAAVSALKKSYSALSQAYTLAVQDNGAPDTWDISSSSKLLDILSPYFKVTKNCGTTISGCFPSVTYKYIVPAGGAGEVVDATSARARAMLADGTLLAINSYTNCTTSRGTSLSLQNICGTLGVDVNGFKSPNQWGVDLFFFYITKYGLVPIGSQQETGTSSFSSNCIGATPNGSSCTAWVIYNENMDYIKCSTLSWDGPTKCP